MRAWPGHHYDHPIRSSTVTRTATAIFLAVLLIGGFIVLAAGLGVEYFGPILVCDGSLVCVYLLLSAPTKTPGKD